jgi:hypothetical protein
MQTTLKKANLLSGGGVLGRLVFPNPDESGKPERNSAIRIDNSGSGAVDRRDREIRCLDLPNLKKRFRSIRFFFERSSN